MHSNHLNCYLLVFKLVSVIAQDLALLQVEPAYEWVNFVALLQFVTELRGILPGKKLKGYLIGL